jgi:hypothetical protein
MIGILQKLILTLVYVEKKLELVLCQLFFLLGSDCCTFSPWDLVAPESCLLFPNTMTCKLISWYHGIIHFFIKVGSSIRSLIWYINLLLLGQWFLLEAINQPLVQNKSLVFMDGLKVNYIFNWVGLMFTLTMVSVDWNFKPFQVKKLDLRGVRQPPGIIY